KWVFLFFWARGLSGPLSLDHPVEDGSVAVNILANQRIVVPELKDGSASLLVVVRNDDLATIHLPGTLFLAVRNHLDVFGELPTRGPLDGSGEGHPEPPDEQVSQQFLIRDGLITGCG